MRRIFIFFTTFRSLRVSKSSKDFAFQNKRKLAKLTRKTHYSQARMQKLIKALEGFDSIRVEKFVTRSKILAGDGVIVNLVILRNGNNRELYSKTQYLANDRGIDEVLDMMASQAMMKLSLPLPKPKPKSSTLDMDSQIDAALAAGSDESDEDLVGEELEGQVDEEERENREMREDTLFQKFFDQTRNLSTLFGGEKGKEEFDKSFSDPATMKHAYRRYKLEKDYFRKVRELDDLEEASATTKEPAPETESLETFSEAYQNQVRTIEESELQRNAIFAGADEPTRNFVLKHLKDPEIVKGIFNASNASGTMEEALSAFMPLVQNIATKVKEDPSRPGLDGGAEGNQEEVSPDSERITPAAFASNIEEAMEKLGMKAPNTKRAEDVPQQMSDLFTAFTTPQGLSALGDMLQNPAVANLMSGMMGGLSTAFANVQPRAADQMTSGKTELGLIEEDLGEDEGEAEEEEDLDFEEEISLTASSAGLPAPDSGSTRGKGLMIIGVDSHDGTSDSFVMELPDNGEVSFAEFPFRKK